MKKIIAFLILFNTFVFNINAVDLDINSNNAILYNLNDNNVIYEKKSEEKVQIASLTKIMTAIVTIDSVDDLNKEIIITNEMLNNLNGYAKAGLKVGDKVTYIDLLYALMLPSGADAAQALAISVSVSIDKFVIEMNKKAKELNLNNTSFSNPIGMDDEDNYSTAYDLANLLKYGLKNNVFKKIFNSNKYTIESINLKLVKTTNDKASKYGLDVSNITGSKTGYTDIAGLCLASTATINNVNYLLVTIGAPTDYPYHLKDAVEIYDYFSTNYEYKKIISKNQILTTLPIKHGKKKKIDIKSQNNIELYLSNEIDINKLEYEYDGVDIITKKIKVGDKLGEVKVKYNDEVLYTYKVVLNEKIEYINYWLYTGLLIGLLLFIFLLKRIKKSKKKIKR